MSRKIDALVAEKVMGLVPCGNPTMFARGAGLKGYPAKPYSTYIAEAWEVVEKMREISGVTITASQIGFPTICSCKCNTANGCSDTAPLAICLAALRAVGVSESEIEAARNQTKGTQ